MSEKNRSRSIENSIEAGPAILLSAMLNNGMNAFKSFKKELLTINVSSNRTEKEEFVAVVVIYSLATRAHIFKRETLILSLPGASGGGLG